MPRKEEPFIRLNDVLDRWAKCAKQRDPDRHEPTDTWHDPGNILLLETIEGAEPEAYDGTMALLVLERNDVTVAVAPITLHSINMPVDIEYDVKIPSEISPFEMMPGSGSFILHSWAYQYIPRAAKPVRKALARIDFDDMHEHDRWKMSYRGIVPMNAWRTMLMGIWSDNLARSFTGLK